MDVSKAAWPMLIASPFKTTFADISNQLLDLVPTQASIAIEFLVTENMSIAYLAKSSPKWRHGYPRQRDFIVLARSNSIHNGSVTEVEVLFLKDLFGRCFRRNDDGEQTAEFETHNRAMNLSKLSQGPVGFIPKIEQIAQDWEPPWTRWELTLIT
ncbi:hypothetical protein V6N13_041044 [Hibiscus sabdariffa]|uniref:Uncharacterized protein n=1 Tax=Hibiscus sabdariffa TaxID=183260 RepID=A0ABR2RA89_9ROSI